MKLTDYIIKFLTGKGIHDFFGYQGTMIAHLVDSVEKNPDAVNHSCYNEQGASFAACGYALAGDRCACAYATSGPGAVNLLSGVANAYFDSLPVVFLTGQLNTYEYEGIPGLRQQGFQEIDIISMAKPITKYCVQIREPEKIVEELNKAYRIATTGRKGPVLIDLPMNIQRSEVEHPVYEMDAEDADGMNRETADRAAAAVLEALGKAGRPVILMGHGVDSRESREGLLKFAEQFQIPVITSVLAKAVMPYDHPLNFGCIGGAYGHRYANMIANAKSDLLLCFGISLCTRQIGVKVHEFAKNAEIIRMDIDPCNLQRNIHEGGEREQKFHVNTADVIGLLRNSSLVKDSETEGTGTVSRAGQAEEWLAVCRTIRENLQAVDDSTPERYPNRAVAALSECLADTSAVAADVGQHMVWCYQSFRNRRGQKLLFSGGHGAMGFALPAAIGAHYATGKPVACICGDGAFQMNIQELQWVKRENLPIKMVVMNNGALGMIRHLQKDYFDSLFAGTTDGCGFSSCDFSRVAAGYGIVSKRILCGEVQEEAGEFLEQDGPILLEIMMEHGTFAYPKTCLGEPVHNQQPYAPKEIYERLLAL
ncbi:MAG: thiamine pyrophosphate-binding protein [Eubacteriales bacterium]|nr:thiamine pyrophosphate-binding protein [Eubacteriales bacterium]